jgi:hypothetical protein
MIIFICSGVVSSSRMMKLSLRVRALEHGQCLVRGRRLELAVVKARALAAVAGRSGRLDERQQRVTVAVQSQRP